MAIFEQLKQQLSDNYAKLDKVGGRGRGIVAVQAQVGIAAADFPLLGWLKAQKNSYPHFFLQYRDCPQSLACVGELRRFHSLEAAQAFIEQYDLPLIGGLQFEGNAQFILPQFTLCQNGDTLTARFYFDTDDAARQAVVFSEFFANGDRIVEPSLPPNRLLGLAAAADFNRWRENVEKAIAAIKQGRFRKVVLANATTLTFENALCGYGLLAESRKTNLGCYHFLWAESEQLAFLGSTPERLYRRTGNRFYTEALAGTAAVVPSEIQTELNAAWLLSDPKNMNENRLVVDDIEEHLQDCVTEFAVAAAEIKRLHNVQHLRRPIQAELKAEIADLDCLSRIHPTAAVAGLPRPEAIRFIAETETFTRDWYAGTLGVMGKRQTEFCVTLRSALIARNSITLYAGAGIVEGSDPKTEWQEISRKSQALAKLLGVETG